MSAIDAILLLAGVDLQGMLESTVFKRKNKLLVASRNFKKYTGGKINVSNYIHYSSNHYSTDIFCIKKTTANI